MRTTEFFSMNLTYLLANIAISTLLTSSHCSSHVRKRCDSPDGKCVHVAALIPARAGSKGIKDKNLSILGSETLIGRTLRVINECGKFDSVWVSTDGKKIADVATEQGAGVHWRDPKTATDNASTLSAVEDFLLNHNESQIVAVVQCTSPFIQSDFLCQALDHMRRMDVDCLFSVTRSHQLRWMETKDGLISPINFDPRQRPRRQSWKGELVENGMFYFAKSELILRDKSLQNTGCRFYEIPKRYSLEIDTQFDLTLARIMLSLSEEKLSHREFNPMTLALKKYFCNNKFWIGRILKVMNAIQLSSFCCIANLRQGTLLIATTELALTSFLLFLLLLGATHVQDMADLVAIDLEQLEENNWSLGHLESLSMYITNNEKKMLTGQQLASLMMALVYSGLIITTIHFISCLLLFYGAIRNLPQYLLPWTLTVLLSIISGCFFIFLLTFLPNQECKIGTYVAGISLLGLELYAWLVVFSYYRELKS